MNIWLINPPTIVENTYNTQPIPLGLYSMKNVLFAHKLNVRIVNLSCCKNWDDVKIALCGIDKISLVGITCYTRQRFSVFHLSTIIKSLNPSCIVAVGGPHASFLDRSILENYSSVDIITRDEGEYTFLELAQAIKSNTLNKLQFIDGITYRNEGRIIHNKDRAFIKNLDELPTLVVPYEDLQLVNSSDSLLFHFPNLADSKMIIAPIITSRGCSGNCLFCCNKAFWGNTRCHSSEYVIKQLKYYYHYGIRFFDFYDDNFTFNLNAIKGLYECVQSERLDIHWWCSSRADFINSQVVSLLKKAGCFMISLGAESGSQSILNAINKNITVKQIETACNLIKMSDVNLRLTISIGHKGESIDTIQETINMINKVKPSQVALYVLKVYPGTPLYKDMLMNNQITDDYWLNPNNSIVPFYTVEHSFPELQSYLYKIESHIKGQIIKRYEDELGSVELDLGWAK